MKNNNPTTSSISRFQLLKATGQWEAAGVKDNAALVAYVPNFSSVFLSVSYSNQGN